MQLQGDIDEADHVVSELLSIQQRRVLPDDPGVLQLLDPRMGRRGRELDTSGDLGVAESTFGLQQLQDLDVRLIQTHLH